MPIYTIQSISTGRFVSDDDDFGSVKITETKPGHGRLYFSKRLEGPETLTTITGRTGGFYISQGIGNSGPVLFWLPVETLWKVVHIPHGYQITPADGRDLYWYPNPKTIHLISKNSVADQREISFHITPVN